MKKIILAIVVIYVGVISFQVYNKNQFNKKWTDEKWQYFKQLIVGNNLNEIEKINIHRWPGKIKIQVLGNATNEDLQTLQNTICQINELITPQIMEVSEHHPNVWIYFQNPKDINKNDSWPKYTFAKYIVNISPHIGFTQDSRNSEDSRLIGYSITQAKLFIKTDSSHQVERNRLMVKGLVHILLGLQNNSLFHPNYQDSAVYLDYSGLNIKFPNYNQHFKNSIFNSFCNNCSELADIDKYIIKTYYSDDLDEIISKNSLHRYMNNNQLVFNIYLALLTFIMLTMYFSGLFHRTIFILIDNRLKSKWLAFNSKVLSIFMVFAILFILIATEHHYTFLSGLKFELHFPNLGNYVLRSVYFLLFLFAYLLIPVNCVYLTEKVGFPKFEQFAKQQLFSFIALEAGIVIANYILMHLLIPMNDGEYMIFVGAGFGIIRFLYNYSNYQKKLAFIEKEQELTQLRELKTRAELNALQSKINPHFLYNALNSIAGLAHENADKVEQMALALSKLFRYSINKEDDDFTTVQNEVEMVSIYLDIEKVRFGDKLQYQILLPKELENEQIPKFIIQPLVENAIKHGISQITSAGLLTLEISKNDTNLKIRISDNGPDFPEDLMTGYGLQNIYEKLDILFPKRYEVILQNGNNKNISVILKNA